MGSRVVKYLALGITQSMRKTNSQQLGGGNSSRPAEDWPYQLSVIDEGGTHRALSENPLTTVRFWGEGGIGSRLSAHQTPLDSSKPAVTQVPLAELSGWVMKQTKSWT